MFTESFRGNRVHTRWSIGARFLVGFSMRPADSTVQWHKSIPNIATAAVPSNSASQKLEALTSA